MCIRDSDDFLGHPKFDPHGDAIPDKHGNMSYSNAVPLNTMGKKQSGVFCGVANHEDRFLQYLDSLDLHLGATIYIESVNAYDASCKVKINNTPVSYTHLHPSLKGLL